MKTKALLIFISFFISQFGFGQEQTFKEIKAVEFEENYKKGDRLIILGERTFINLKSWDKNIVSVKAEIISRYKDQRIAKEDLEKIDLNFNKSGKKITYSNAIRISSPKDKPLANLKVYLEVFVPKDAIVEIENHFGEINIEASLSKLTIESDFTAISINNSKGNFDITTMYGDTFVDGLDANINLVADRSNLILKKIKGELEIDVKYSEVELYPTNNTIFNKFRAKYSPINVSLNSEYTNALDIVCKGCEVKYDNSLESISNSNQDASHVVVNQGAKSNGTINSEIEDIQIK